MSACPREDGEAVTDDVWWPTTAGEIVEMALLPLSLPLLAEAIRSAPNMVNYYGTSSMEDTHEMCTF